ncbi:MAG: PAS domain-containing protein [Acidobacteria bacterium]|nr:MAG: PAS domain-containing protein [Acidobacteriota bacterium]REJ98055.1 MAG: PAS domain-containing protein [Acidobacteriota bacterium]REK16798.1 MAG: PAS domain-containing protein [Acidobacteriota bacterium]REK42709.1 MAG: PAS domain-containing protein [Acidobacteriota bacterium]
MTEKPQISVEDNADRGPDLLLLKDRALDIAAEGITIADMRSAEQPLIYINEGFERLTGYSAAAMMGKNCRFLQGADTDPDTVQQIRNALKNGEECTVEILNYTKSGVAFWNRLSLTPVLDNEGKVTHFIGIQSDITKRKKAEDALREANRLLEEANLRMVSNLEAAARIQRSLLPEKEQSYAGVRFASVVQPCDELGGDALNIVPLQGNRYAVYAVDVSGHGVRASLLSVTLSHWFARVLAGPKGRGFEFTPVEVAEELNRQFKIDEENIQYFTMCFGILDVDAGDFRYVTAGAPPVVAVRNGSESEILEIGGFPVGLVNEPAYTETVLRLKERDRIFIYTDGITEAENAAGEQFGSKRLASELVKHSESDLGSAIDGVLESVSRWETTSGHEDDCSILGIEPTGEGS